MGWVNITRNVGDLGESVIGWLAAQNHLWVITEPSSGRARLREAELAQSDPAPAWSMSFIELPPATEYGIVGSVENLVTGNLFIANGPTGQVFYNNTGDPNNDSWSTISSRQYGDYSDETANIQDIICYNGQIFMAHKGGVSVLEYGAGSMDDTATWEVIGDFTTNEFTGVGQCNGLQIFRGELYVTVAFAGLGAVYKYNNTLQWVKFADLPEAFIHPAKFTVRNNVLFLTNYNTGQNIFNSSDIDSVITGQPRFTEGVHLNGAPSSILTHSTDNSIYVTCWNKGFSGSTSDTFTSNLIADVQAEGGDTGDLGGLGGSAGKIIVPDDDIIENIDISSITGEVLDAYAIHENKFGGDYFSCDEVGHDTTPVSSIRFAIQTNTLTFKPNASYTISWESGYSGQLMYRIFEGGGLIPLPGGGSTGTIGRPQYFSAISTERAGFASGNTLDGSSPVGHYSEDTANLRDNGTGTVKHELTFDGSLLSSANSAFRLEGAVAAGYKGGRILPGYQIDWAFFAKYLIKNITIRRGTSIGGDEYFYDDDTPATIYLDPEYIHKKYSDVPEADREQHYIAEPSPPDQWFVKYPPKGQIGSPIGVPAPPDQTVIRKLITNSMNLVSDEVYRFHMALKKVKSWAGPDSQLRVTIQSSLDRISSYTSTIVTSNTQHFIEWEFSTANISAESLQNMHFEIEMSDTGVYAANAAAIYVSDINILGKLNQAPVNTIYRYSGEVWDDTVTKISDDGGITSGHPYALVESYEVNSDAQRLYCISGGDPYVWSIGPGDPYGGAARSQIIISW